MKRHATERMSMKNLKSTSNERLEHEGVILEDPDYEYLEIITHMGKRREGECLLGPIPQGPQETLVKADKL